MYTLVIDKFYKNVFYRGVYMDEWDKLIQDIKKHHTPDEVRRILYVYNAYNILDNKSKEVFHSKENVQKEKV